MIILRVSNQFNLIHADVASLAVYIIMCPMTTMYMYMYISYIRP